MKVGRISVRSVASISKFRERARTPGALNDEMGSRVAFFFDWRRMMASRASRLSLRFSGACIPSPRLVGFRTTDLALALIQPTFLVGGMIVRFCYLLRISHCRGSLPTVGGYTLWPGRPL